MEYYTVITNYDMHSYLTLDNVCNIDGQMTKVGYKIAGILLSHL